MKHDESVDVQVLDTLLREAVSLSEPLKSHYVVEVWNHFDAVNSLLQSAKLGEDFVYAAKKARSSNPVPKVQMNDVADVIQYLKKVPHSGGDLNASK